MQTFPAKCVFVTRGSKQTICVVWRSTNGAPLSFNTESFQKLRQITFILPHTAAASHATLKKCGGVKLSCNSSKPSYFLTKSQQEKSREKLSTTCQAQVKKSDYKHQTLFSSFLVKMQTHSTTEQVDKATFYQCSFNTF